TEAEFRGHFGFNKHTFTGVDYIEYYKELIVERGAEVEVIFSNNAKTILDYTKSILTCDIHSRFRTKRILKAAGAEKIYGLDNILAESVNGSGFNSKYGLLGSNKSTEDGVKLFPDNCQPIVDDIQAKILAATGKLVEVMIYGDGAFKDPVGEIWELADPVVSPSYTKGLVGSPNELKLKYISDDLFKDLRGDALKKAVIEEVRKKSTQATDDAKLGTTPRRYVDLIGSLCDLMSGSGDRGTPVIYIKNYFKNIADES